ncbi:MAG: 3-dehydroquinate synthase, partial [Owenweeksia sp.]
MPQNILFDNEALGDFQQYLKNGSFSKVFFLVDENTHEHCLVPLLQELEELGDSEILEVEAGEVSKSVEVLFQLWMTLSDLGADRYSLIVNLGGGMVSDLGGFLAGTYMRGIPFVNFPTSVLAQVDASVGGKTGINLDHIKNKVGLFAKAERVYILNHFLESLPLQERRSGYAEMLKHGLIADAEYWETLLKLDIENELPTPEMIRRSIAIKSAIVESDFKETGIRKALNFGHTLGHAFETVSHEMEEPLLHGEAVALGMMGELLLSVEYAGLNEAIATEAIRSVHSRFKDVEAVGDMDRIFEVLKQDKKNRKGEIIFTLLPSIGEVVTDVKVQEHSVHNVLKRLQ